MKTLPLWAHIIFGVIFFGACAVFLYFLIRDIIASIRDWREIRKRREP